MTPRGPELDAEVGSLLNEPPAKDAATEAFDAIAKLCGCPEWDYPGQLVRDVERLARERDAARADVIAAAGELLVPIPEPGSVLARLLSANAIMRRERDEARARAREACQAAVAVVGADGPCNVDEAVRRLAERAVTWREDLATERTAHRVTAEHQKAAAQRCVAAEARVRELEAKEAERVARVSRGSGAGRSCTRCGGLDHFLLCGPCQKAVAAT